MPRFTLMADADVVARRRATDAAADAVAADVRSAGRALIAARRDLQRAQADRTRRQEQAHGRLLERLARLYAPIR